MEVLKLSEESIIRFIRDFSGKSTEDMHHGFNENKRTINNMIVNKSPDIPTGSTIEYSCSHDISGTQLTVTVLKYYKVVELDSFYNKIVLEKEEVKQM